jgi:glucosamine-6-phosphate deaminase
MAPAWLRLSSTVVRHKRTAVLGLATGSMPLPVYNALVEKHRAGLSLASIRGSALDEYLGLPADHPESFHSVLQRELTSPVDFAPAWLSTPDGRAKVIPAACQACEESIRAAGGIDLQLLGLGTDGHIGFNEPTSSLASLTRIKTLTEQTRRDKARFIGDDLQVVPRHVITQGCTPK